jgi:hypothetical protein
LSHTHSDRCPKYLNSTTCLSLHVWLLAAPVPRPRNNSKPRTRPTLRLFNRIDRKALSHHTLLAVATNRLRLSSNSSMARHPSISNSNLNTGSNNNSSSRAVTHDLRLPRRLRTDSRLLTVPHHTVLRHTALRRTTRALDSLRKAMADMFVFTCIAIFARIWIE